MSLLEAKLLTEADLKMGRSIEFNLASMVEADTKTKSEYYRVLINGGAITPNQIATFESLPIYEGGEDHYIMSNMMSVEVYNQKNSKEALQLEIQKKEAELKKLEEDVKE